MYKRQVLTSILGRVFYSYQNKYLFTATIRRDGSSKFGKNNRYGFELVFCVYEKYESLQIFSVVKHFIRPIISGLLLTVAVSLYTSGIRGQVQTGSGHPALVITLIVIAVNLVLMWLQRRGKNIHLIWKIVISAGISFAGCNLFL